MKPRFSISLLLFLAACGAAIQPPPSNINDACSIKVERPKWYKAMLGAEKKWDVPVAVQMAVIYQESKFKGQARTPLSYTLGVIPMGRSSSAYGYSQAIDSTWKWYKRETGNRSAKRDNFGDSTDFMGWYFDQSAQKLGIPKTSARKQYLAYHDGHSGYRRGTYKRKKWLLKIADEVEARSKTYGEQMLTCNG